MDDFQSIFKDPVISNFLINFRILLNTFYKDITRFKKELNAKGRNIASEEYLEMLNELLLNAELAIHANWVEDFSNKYNN